jgi:hypothetical protein
MASTALARHRRRAFGLPAGQLIAAHGPAAAALVAAMAPADVRPAPTPGPATRPVILTAAWVPVPA